MDTTDNRGYPYPQCAPPLIKDVADMPTQMRALAEAIDADLTVANDEADAALNPPCAYLVNLFAQVLAPGDTVNAGSQVFLRDTTAAAGRFTVADAGLWLLTGSLSGTNAPTIFHNLSLAVNGSIIRTSGINPNAAGGDPVDNCVHEYAILAPGDVVSMSQNFTGAASITYQTATLGGVLISRLP